MTEPPVHALTQHEFRISRVFSRASTLVVRNFWTFFIVTAISELPARAYFRWGNAAGELLASNIMRAVTTFLGFVLVLLGQAVLVHIGFRTLRGQAAGLRTALQDASASFSPILGLSLVISLLIFGIPAVIVLWASDLGPGLVALVFMIVAGVLFVRWSLALPACVVERLGLVDSLASSAKLTSGHRWKIFGIIILVCAPLPIVSSILRAAMSLLGADLRYLGQFVLGVVWITSFTSVLTVIYHDLRVAQDGVDGEQIASVFD
jgi:hypothetical protein